MANPLENLDEALETIEKMGIKTSQGVFVKMDDVRRLLADKKELEAEEKDKPQPKTFHEARKAIRGDKELMEALGPKQPAGAGRAIPAGPTAVEGVKRRPERS